MRYRTSLSTLLVVLMAVALVQPTRAAQSEPSVKEALLTVDDLPPGFQLFIEPPPIGGVNRFGVAFVRSVGSGPTRVFDSLELDLIDDARVTVSDGVDAFFSGLGALSTVENRMRVEDPPIGMIAVRYTFTAQLQNVSVNGDVIVWRSSGIVGIAGLLTNAPADVLPYAERQDAKLMAFIAAPPAATTAVPFVGLVNCASFTNQEAAQALLMLTPGDPYGLDPDGNGVACDELPRRSALQAPALMPVPQPHGILWL